MKYKLQEGLVRETVCGKELLIATLEARKTCPYLMELNTASAFIWDCLAEGMGSEELIDRVVSEYDIPRETAEPKVLSFLEQLEKNAYITSRSTL